MFYRLIQEDHAFQGETMNRKKYIPQVSCFYSIYYLQVEIKLDSMFYTEKKGWRGGEWDKRRFSFKRRQKF